LSPSPPAICAGIPWTYVEFSIWPIPGFLPHEMQEGQTGGAAAGAHFLQHRTRKWLMWVRWMRTWDVLLDVLS